MEKWKFLTLPGLEPRPLSRPARSQSLYRLRDPGYFIKLILKTLNIILPVVHRQLRVQYNVQSINAFWEIIDSYCEKLCLYEAHVHSVGRMRPLSVTALVIVVFSSGKSKTEKQVTYISRVISLILMTQEECTDFFICQHVLPYVHTAVSTVCYSSAILLRFTIVRILYCFLLRYNTV
jgi:hypothetical protein